MKEAISKMLEQMGADLSDPSFRETPARFEKVLYDLIGGNGKQAPDLKTFPAKATGDLVVVKNIQAATLCPHHCLPYLLTAHFGYIPDTQVVGISKPARLLEWCCHRLILQEEIGPMFVEEFDKAVKPRGSIFVLKGIHLCTTIRGAKQQESTTSTVVKSGRFLWDTQVREEFWQIVRMNGEH